MACRHGQLAVVEELGWKATDAPASKQTADKQGCTPYMAACRHGHVEVVEHLTRMQQRMADDFAGRAAEETAREAARVKAEDEHEKKSTAAPVPSPDAAVKMLRAKETLMHEEVEQGKVARAVAFRSSDTHRACGDYYVTSSSTECGRRIYAGDLHGNTCSYEADGKRWLIKDKDSGILGATHAGQGGQGGQCCIIECIPTHADTVLDLVQCQRF